MVADDQVEDRVKVKLHEIATNERDALDVVPHLRARLDICRHEGRHPIKAAQERALKGTNIQRREGVWRLEACKRHHGLIER